jgi:hypothetical protein
MLTVFAPVSRPPRTENFDNINGSLVTHWVQQELDAFCWAGK